MLGLPVPLPCKQTEERGRPGNEARQPEGLRTVNMKFTQIHKYYAKHKHFSYFSGPGTSDCSGCNM